MGITLFFHANTQNITLLEYSVDSDPGIGNATPVSFPKESMVEYSFSLDVNALDEGIHKLYYRVRDTLGNWSQTYNRVFVKIDDDIVAPRDYVVFEYFFDEQTALLGGKTTFIDTTSWDGEFTLNAPVEQLEKGIHKLYYRFRGKNGHWSQTYNRTFLKERLQTDLAPGIDYLEYHLNEDNGFGNGVAVDVSEYQGDSIEFVADITGLKDTNEIYIYARNDHNQWSFEYHDKFYVDTSECEPYLFTESYSICNGNVLNWRDDEYYEAGTYYDSLTSVGGCDSIYQLDLTVYDLPTVNLGSNQTITSDDSVKLDPGEYSSYLWQDNSTYRTFTVYGSEYTSGEYDFWVRVTDENTCQASDTITITIESAIGTYNLQERNSVLIYPNPARDKLNIEFDNINGEQLHLEIISLDGKVIYSDVFQHPFRNSTKTIDLSEFSRGVYTIRLSKGKTFKTERLIIK